MSIIKFTKENKDACLCPVCSLLAKYTQPIINAKDENELELLLEKLIADAGDIGSGIAFENGFEEGYKEGFKESIKTDIEIKEQVLDSLEEDEFDECCGECEDDECECTSKY